MKKINPWILAIAFIGCLASSAQASFIGETAVLQKFRPNLNELKYEDFSFVDDGIEFAFDDNGFSGFSEWQMDISDNTIFVQSLMEFNASFTNNTFNGWVLSDAFNNIEDIISVSLSDSNVAGLNNGRIGFDANSISLNWAGLEWRTDSMFTLNVLFASDRDGNVEVSEPSMFSILLMAFAGLIYSRRKIAFKKQ